MSQWAKKNFSAAMTDWKLKIEDEESRSKTAYDVIKMRDYLSIFRGFLSHSSSPHPSFLWCQNYFLRDFLHLPQILFYTLFCPSVCLFFRFLCYEDWTSSLKLICKFFHSMIFCASLQYIDGFIFVYSNTFHALAFNFNFIIKVLTVWN